MDFNFLIFPKPEFSSASDAFYSKLILIPRKTTLIKKNIGVMKKPSLAIHQKRADGHGELIYPDMEGCAMVPRSSNGKAYIFLQGKCLSPKMIEKVESAADSSFKDIIEAESPIKNPVRSMNPVFLKLNKKGKQVVESKAEEIVSSIEFSPSHKPLDVRKLNIKSSRFARDHFDQHASATTLTKLVNTLSKYQGDNIKLISHVGKQTTGKKPLIVRQNLTSAKKTELCVPFDEDFAAPIERSHEELVSHNIELNYGYPEKLNLTSDQQGLTRSLQKRSLQQLNLKFSPSPGKPLHFDSSLTLAKLKNPASKQPNMQLNNMTHFVQNNKLSCNLPDPSEEIAKSQSPGSKMAQYTKGKQQGLKLGQMFVKRKVPINGRPCFIKDQLGSITQANLTIQPKLSEASEAAKNRNLIHNKLNETDSIPCLLIPPDAPTDMVLLYFHANGEDILQSQFVCELLKTAFNVRFVDQCWVVAMEYPGYSVYKANHISEEIIMQDSDLVMTHIINKFNVKLDRILIMGRSLGTGPACWLATKYPAAGLILVSPFTSIKDVASEHYGLIGGLLVKNRFNNLENIKKTKCPTLIIHGQKDNLVPFRHGQLLSGMIR